MPLGGRTAANRQLRRSRIGDDVEALTVEHKFGLNIECRNI